MTGKRAATSELNDRNWDQEEEPEEAGVFQQANADILKNRVIKKAKRRGAPTAEGKSVFSGFGGFGSSATSAAAVGAGAAAGASAAAGAFDFLSSSTSNGSDKKTTTTGFSFGSSSSNNGNGAASTLSTGFAFGAKPSEPPRANFSFGSGASAGDEPDAASLPVFGKPPETSPPTAAPSFFGSFGSSSKASENKSPENDGSGVSETPSKGFSFGVFSQKTKSDTAPKTDEKSENTPKSGGFDFSGLKKPSTGEAKWECSTCMVRNADDKDVCLSCETPKPGAAPAKKSTESSSSAFKVTPGGGFNFSGLTKPVSSGGTWSCSACMASNPNDKDNCLCCETPKPGAAPQKKAAEPAKPNFEVKPGGGFKFGSTPDTDSSKASAGFSFGSSSSSATANVSATSTGFKFGGSTDSTQTTATGFKFGCNTPMDDAKIKATSADTAESPTSSSEDKQKEYLTHLSSLNKQFAKWISQNVEQDSLVLLTPCIKDYEKHLEELKGKYGELPFRGEKGDKPFEAKKATKELPKETNKPLLGAFFGSKSADVDNTSKEKPSPEKPANAGFSFGSKKQETAPTSTFSFGDSKTKQPSDTGFSFTSKSAEKPAASTFSFGSGATSSEPPKAGFSFGTGTSTLPPFGSGSSSIFGAAAAKAMEAKKDEPAQEEEGDEDQPPKVEVTSVVEEDSIHSVRCKLFYMKDKHFNEKGLGMLHLKKVEGDKIQLLVRAETNLGNILLNILVNPQMNLTKRGNNLQFTCVPNPPIPDMEGPVTMLFKVKNADMAATLEEKIKEFI